MRINTIWHYAFSFLETEVELFDAQYDLPDIIYSGRIDEMGYDLASKIAQIHPKCIDYYQSAMMPLFQGKGILSKGTENPVAAIDSYKTFKESEKETPYIIIWRIFKPRDLNA